MDFGENEIEREREIEKRETADLRKKDKKIDRKMYRESETKDIKKKNLSKLQYKNKC